MLTSEGNAQLIDAIYDAALDPGNWPRVLERFTLAYGSSSAHLSVENYAMTEGRMISFGADPAHAQRYADYYVTCNVLWERLMQKPDAEVATSRTVMPWEEFRRTEFCTDFLRPQDGEEVLISIALKQTDRVSCLTLWRPEGMGPWGAKQMKALTELTPHLRHALRVNQCIGDQRLVHDLASEALHQLDHGVIFVDAQAQLLFANRAAGALLAERGGLHIEQRRLAARKAADTTALRQLIADAAKGATGGSLVIAREMRPSMIVFVVPAKSEFSSLVRQTPSVIVFIKDLERPATFSLTAFAQHFELTPAQAALAHETLRGDGIHAAATRLGVSYATARTHLLQIFQKTGCARQAELVRLMLEWNERPILAASGNARLKKRN